VRNSQADKPKLASSRKVDFVAVGPEFDYDREIIELE
jgi:hypothetical protein